MLFYFDHQKKKKQIRKVRLQTESNFFQVKAVCECFEMSKDTGYKVVIHMMPNLPNVGIERDMEQFIELFENPAFRPDGLKLYPTLVIRGTGLYELWKTGRYKSYPPEVFLKYSLLFSSGSLFQQ